MVFLTFVWSYRYWRAQTPREDSNSTFPFSNEDQPDIGLKAKILSHKINLKLSQFAGWRWGSPEHSIFLRPEIRWHIKSPYMVHVLNWRQIFWPAPNVPSFWFSSSLARSHERQTTTAIFFWGGGGCGEPLVMHSTVLALPLLGCHALKPMCPVINLMHFTLKLMHHLWNQIYQLLRHTPYTGSESPPTELKTSRAVHTINQPKMELSALYAKNSSIMP